MTQEQLEQFARARLGATLKDKWTLEELLGVGGTASVYSASHRNGKRVALKVLHPELSAHEHFRERFLREAYVGNHIEHEGAVTVYDDDETEDHCAFLVMDLLEGENFEVRRDRKGGVLEPLEVLSLMDDVLDTLQAAHSKGVIHRDIKPENLFLTHENTVRLLDFGIARINVPESPGQTLAGVSMGTPAFMPPEQASAHWDKVDAQSDIWAIGASMFTLLTGRYVHQGGTVNESLVLAVTRPAPKIENIDPSLPRPIVDIVNKALQRDKSARYKSAAEMQFEVRAAYRELQADSREGQRYSLTDGRLAVHSSPPAPIGLSDFDPLGDAMLGPITADPVSTETEAALRAMSSGRLDWRKLGMVAGVGAIALALLLWGFSGGDGPELVATPEPDRTAAAPPLADWSDLRRQVEDGPKQQQAVAAANAATGKDSGGDPDSGAKGTGSPKRSVASKAIRSSNKGRPRVRPGVRPSPAPAVAPAPPVEREAFDPFEKRH